MIDFSAYRVEGLVGSDTLLMEPVFIPASNEPVTSLRASGAYAGENYTITYVDGTLTLTGHATEAECLQGICPVCEQSIRGEISLGTFAVSKIGTSHIQVRYGNVSGIHNIRFDQTTLTLSGGFLSAPVTVRLLDGKLVSTGGEIGDLNTIGYMYGGFDENGLWFYYANPKTTENYPDGTDRPIAFRLQVKGLDGTEYVSEGTFALTYVDYAVTNAKTTERGAEITVNFATRDGDKLTASVYQAGDYQVELSDYYGGSETYSYTLTTSLTNDVTISRTDDENGATIKFTSPGGVTVETDDPADASKISVVGNGYPQVTVTVTETVRIKYTLFDPNEGSIPKWLTVVVSGTDSITAEAFMADLTTEGEYTVAKDGTTKYRGTPVPVYLVTEGYVLIDKTTGNIPFFLFDADSGRTYTFQKDNIVAYRGNERFSLAEDVTITVDLPIVNGHSYADASCTVAKTCAYCDTTEGQPLEHLDENHDHTCDYGCQTAIGTHADSATDKDHLCDYGCGATLEAHTPLPDDGDCVTDIICATCGETATAGAESHAFGSWQKHNAEKHKMKCSACEFVLFDEHDWNEGEITTYPTCTEQGEQTFVCIDCGEVAVCEVSVDENAHTDTDTDDICDGCGAELPRDGLSGGAIAGIVCGSVATVGIGGFALFWFVVKENSWAEFLGIFRRT